MLFASVIMLQLCFSSCGSFIQCCWILHDVCVYVCVHIYMHIYNCPQMYFKMIHVSVTVATALIIAFAGSAWVCFSFSIGILKKREKGVSDIRGLNAKLTSISCSRLQILFCFFQRKTWKPWILSFQLTLERFKPLHLLTKQRSDHQKAAGSGVIALLIFSLSLHLTFLADRKLLNCA